MRRRHFIASAAGAGAALLVGWGLLPPRSRTGPPSPLPGEGGEVALNGWIRIGADGGVGLVMPRAEMGQGVHTALAMLVAEELEVPLERIALLPAGHDSRYGNVAAAVDALLFFPPGEREPGQETALLRGTRWLLGKAVRELGVIATGGSASVADAWDVLPLAAATARSQLLGAASLDWRLPKDELFVRDGVVQHASGPRAGYGELAARAAATPPGRVKLKPRAQWRLVGTSAPRVDLPAKLDGSARFGIDVRLPGQVYAAVRHAPALGGSPGAVANVDEVLRRPGVERVLRLGPYAGSTPGVAVVARSSWHALEAARALQVQWQPNPAGAPDSAAIRDTLAAEAARAARGDAGFEFHREGDALAALAEAPRTLQALYHAPYLAHATLEPINCTARVHEGRVEVWVPTQVPDFARALAAQVARVPEAAVTVHVTYLGGGFGRRLEVDMVGQAVRVALDTGGRPVQLLWSREDDLAHDFYRPAAAAVLRAALADDGRPLALAVGTAGDAVMPRYYERVYPLLATPVDLPDKTAAEGLFDLPYAIAQRRVAHVATRSGVPVGSWRSVGHSHNAFFGECFVDELAHAAGQDPVALRLSLLAALPRHAAVLLRAAQAAGWGSAPPAGRARGIALHESYGTIVAQVVEVAREGERARVARVVCAVDCGTVVHPDGVAQQMESGVVFGLTAVLHGCIDVDAGVVRQRRLADYRLLALRDTPAIETHIVPSTRAPGGMGEPGTPPVAPALANALFALTGRRQRELPLRLAL